MSRKPAADRVYRVVEIERTRHMYYPTLQRTHVCVDRYWVAKRVRTAHEEEHMRVMEPRWYDLAEARAEAAKRNAKPVSFANLGRCILLAADCERAGWRANGRG